MFKKMHSGEICIEKYSGLGKLLPFINADFF